MEDSTIGYDIKITDANINDLKDRCDNHKEEFIKNLNTFTNILDKILEDGIASGEFHEKIKLFRENFNGMDEDIEEINKKLKEQIENYLGDFEKADGELY